MECNMCNSEMVELFCDEWICPECGNKAYLDKNNNVFYECDDYAYANVYSCYEDL